MSCSSEVRLELLRDVPTDECCARAQFAALLFTTGGITVRGAGRYSAFLCSEQAAVARSAFEWVARHAGLEPEVQSSSSARLGGRVRYRLTFDEEQTSRLLTWLELLDPTAPFGLRQSPPISLYRKACCARAYARGAFLGCGAMSPPEKAYHLEFALPDERQATLITRLLARRKIDTKTVERKNRHVVYMKDGERIFELLRWLGAHRALLALENARILKQVRNSVNRQVNCDARNLESALGAAQRQLDAIRFIRDRAGLDSLPGPLRQIALLRLEYEEASLSELGELLEPPLGKSGVNNRLRRLCALADGMREKS